MPGIVHGSSGNAGIDLSTITTEVDYKHGYTHGATFTDTIHGTLISFDYAYYNYQSLNSKYIYFKDGSHIALEKGNAYHENVDYITYFVDSDNSHNGTFVGVVNKIVDPNW